MSRATLARERLLLEREGELAAIRAAVGQAGEGRLLVAEGPAGIGKSRLITEARAAATTAGLHVCAARGSELERAFPFGVVRQLRRSPTRGRRSWTEWPAGRGRCSRPPARRPSPRGAMTRPSRCSTGSTGCAST
ncbi:MAG: AAA family ATPase [Thermoleophilia bacterium]|nr:AAA family ATPase [Thermoleophilia bacterium]